MQIHDPPPSLAKSNAPWLVCYPPSGRQQTEWGGGTHGSSQNSERGCKRVTLSIASQARRLILSSAFGGDLARTPNRFSHLHPPAHTLPPALQCPRGNYPRTSRSKIRPSDRWDVVATALHRCATLAVSGGAFLDASWGRQPRPVVSASWDLAAVAAGIATTALSRWCAAAAAAIAAIDLELGRLLAHVKKRTAHTGTGVIVFRSNSIYFRMSFPNQRVKRRHQHACLSSS